MRVMRMQDAGVEGCGFCSGLRFRAGLGFRIFGAAVLGSFWACECLGVSGLVSRVAILVHPKP